MPIDRSALRAAYRQEEAACIAERLRQAAPATAVHDEAAALASRLIEGARERKASGLDAFLQTFGLGESSAQQLINDHIRDWPPEVALGFRAGAPQLEIKLTIAEPGAQAALQGCRARLEALFGDHILGEGDTQLADVVLGLLRERGATLATAESCTGGLIAATLTRVPGASSAFHTGFVTYANESKQALLGVHAQTLEQHGAVSEAVVLRRDAPAVKPWACLPLLIGVMGGVLAVVVDGRAARTRRALRHE